MNRLNSQPYTPLNMPGTASNSGFNMMPQPQMNMDNMNNLPGMNPMMMHQNQQIFTTQSCSLAISSVHKIKEL